MVQKLGVRLSILHQVELCEGTAGVHYDLTGFAIVFTFIDGIFFDIDALEISAVCAFSPMKRCIAFFGKSRYNQRGRVSL